MSAHEPPELPPIVARPAGSLVSFTPHFLSTSGNTSFSINSAYTPLMVSYSRPRSLPWASPLPLPTEMAIIAGTLPSAIRLSNTVKSKLSGPSAPTINGALVPATYCFGTYTATWRVYDAEWLVVTINLAGFAGSTVPNVLGSLAMPG